MAITLNFTNSGKSKILEGVTNRLKYAILCSDTNGSTLGSSIGRIGDLPAKSSNGIGNLTELIWFTDGATRKTSNKPSDENSLIFPISSGKNVRYLAILQEVTGGDYVVRGHIDIGSQTPTKISAYVIDNIAISI